MATTNANESRAKDFYKVNSGNKNNYRPNESYKPKDVSYKPRENDFKTKDNNYKPKDNNYKPRDNSFQPRGNEYKPRENSYKPRENDYRSRDNSFKPGDNEFKPRDNGYRSKDNTFKAGVNRNTFSYAKNKDFQRNSFMDKDEDLDNKGQRSHKSFDSRAKGSNVKEKEQQPDKFETIKRLEREKKAMQKKLREDDDTDKIKRPIPKQKKGSRIDWTKGYQYGLLDEEEDYSEYL